MLNTPDTDIIDLMDLINFTLSNEFTEKWRFKYSSKFIKLFQLKILEALTKRKPLKIDTLYLYLHRRCKYSDQQIVEFFKSIDVGLYAPVIYGKATKFSF